MRPRFDLLPWPVIREEAEVLALGCETHPEEGWKLIDETEHINAALGHLGRHISGDLYDADTGKMHLFHALVRLSFVAWLEIDHGRNVRR